jgi:hypothetical protein
MGGLLCGRPFLVREASHEARDKHRNGLSRSKLGNHCAMRAEIQVSATVLGLKHVAPSSATRLPRNGECPPFVPVKTPCIAVITKGQPPCQSCLSRYHQNLLLIACGCNTVCVSSSIRCGRKRYRGLESEDIGLRGACGSSVGFQHGNVLYGITAIRHDNRSNRFYRPFYLLLVSSMEQTVRTTPAERDIEAESFKERCEGRAIHHEKAARGLHRIRSLCSPYGFG